MKIKIDNSFKIDPFSDLYPILQQQQQKCMLRAPMNINTNIYCPPLLNIFVCGGSPYKSRRYYYSSQAHSDLEQLINTNIYLVTTIKKRN